MSETASDTPLRRTPLYQQHSDAGARLVPFAGWEMPVHYGSQLEEHQATREGCGLFDVSHMGQIFVEGRGARALVNAIVARDVSDLPTGRSLYTVLCNGEGGLLDDLIVTCLAEERFLLVVNAATYEGDLAAMQARAAACAIPEATLRGAAEDWAMIAVQGPDANAILNSVIGDGGWEALPAFSAAELSWQGEPLLLSTTGYTGEHGAELLCPPGQAPALWVALVDAGGRPVGLAARDSLRLEKGLWLSGQDFTSDNNPYEAAMGWVVDLEKSDYPGRAALAAIKAAGPARKLVGLRPEGRRIPRHGAAIMQGEQVIGEVTSGGFSPALEGPIALGYVMADQASLGNTVEIDLGRSRVTATLCKRCFVPAS